MARVSLSATAVLLAISRGSRHGFDIMDAAALPSGTVYPVLARLEERGYVRSKWEPPSTAQKDRRPPRRYYTITAAGREALATSIEHYRTLGHRVSPTADLAWKPE
jgi:DNA-binding PadR family transcriptional regulator